MTRFEVCHVVKWIRRVPIHFQLGAVQLSEPTAPFQLGAAVGSRRVRIVRPLEGAVGSRQVRTCFGTFRHLFRLSASRT